MKYKLLLLINFLTSALSASDVSAIREGDPSANISKFANVFTGDFYVKENDLIVKGVEPIVFERFYSSFQHQNEMRGWDLFSEIELKTEMVRQIIKVDQKSYHNPRCKSKTWKIIHKIGITNTSKGSISARTNILNDTIVKRKVGYLLKCADGTEKHYTHKKDDQTYLLRQVDLPNGNHRYYSYAQNKLVRIYTTNPASNTIYTWINIDWRTGKNFTIYSSDGKSVEFSYNGSKLNEIQTNFGYFEKFSYDKRLCHRELPEGRITHIDYYDKRSINIDGEACKITSSSDQRIARVRQVSTRIGKKWFIPPIKLLSL